MTGSSLVMPPIYRSEILSTIGMVPTKLDMHVLATESCMRLHFVRIF